jgi:hypothetical protein
MYIILEAYADNDPRLVPEMEFLDQYYYWHFDVVYIAPENVSKIDFTQLNYCEVTEEQARACKFAKADHNYRIGIRKNTTIHEELIMSTMSRPEALVDHPEGKPKVYYTITDEELALAMEYTKVCMRLELNMHYNQLSEEDAERNATYRQAILDEINACPNLHDCRYLMHTKFGTASSSVMRDAEDWGPTVLALSE